MNRVSRATDQRGVALPLALFTLVIAAVMITAVFWVARLEQRMGYNSIASTQASEAAEAGASNTVANWITSYGGMANGDTIVIGPTATGSRGVYTVKVRRLNTSLYLVQSEGKVMVAGQPVTRRQVARLIRLLSPEIYPNAALTTRMAMELKDSARIDGNDNVPFGWGISCGGSFPDVYGVVDSAGAVNSHGSCPGPGCVTGDPDPFRTSSFMARTSVYNDFGSVDFATLAGAADKILAPGATVTGTAPFPTSGMGPCQTSLASNWGDGDDPMGRCGNYFPIIYAQGDLTLQGPGVGQGVLLVQGDLNFAGAPGSSLFKFRGIIVVQGTITATHGQVLGTVMVAGNGFGSNVIGGDMEIRYSHCGVDRSATGAAIADPLRERGWIQLY